MSGLITPTPLISEEVRRDSQEHVPALEESVDSFLRPVLRMRSRISYFLVDERRGVGKKGDLVFVTADKTKLRLGGDGAGERSTCPCFWLCYISIFTWNRFSSAI